LKAVGLAATADAYAQAYLAPDSPNPVDALTVSAWKSAFKEQLDRQIEDIAENLWNPKPAAA
jgi:hypothetical protein